MEQPLRQLSRSTSRTFPKTSRTLQKTWQERCKDLLRTLLAFMFTNVGIVGLVVSYTTGGAFMFQYIEEGVSRTNLEEAVKNRTTATEKLWQVTDKVNIFNHSSWESDVKRILKDHQKWFVINSQKGVDINNPQWSFPGAFLYSLTVITTIGYGNLSPKTDPGKLATVVYAIIGMPLFLLYLSNIGDILARCFKWAYYKMCLCRGCPGTTSFRKRTGRSCDIPMAMAKIQPPHGQYLSQRQWQVTRAEEGAGKQRSSSPSTDDSEKEDSDEEDGSGDSGDSNGSGGSTGSVYDPMAVTVPITLCLAFMVGYVMVGAWLFQFWENWSVLDGSYFCFISLSTIGFGDIVPGEKIYNHTSQNLSVSFIATAVYLMLGMALIAMCFNLMQEEVIHKTRSCINACQNIFSYCRRAPLDERQ